MFFSFEGAKDSNSESCEQEGRRRKHSTHMVREDRGKTKASSWVQARV